MLGNCISVAANYSMVLLENAGKVIAKLVLEPLLVASRITVAVRKEPITHYNRTELLPLLERIHYQCWPRRLKKKHKINQIISNPQTKNKHI